MRRVPLFTVITTSVLFGLWVVIPTIALLQKGVTADYHIAIRASTQTALDWLVWTTFFTGIVLFRFGWIFQAARLQAKSVWRAVIVTLVCLLVLWILIPGLARGEQANKPFPLTLHAQQSATGWFYGSLLITGIALVLAGVRCRIARERRADPTKISQLVNDYGSEGLILFNRRTLQPRWMNNASKTLLLRDGQLTQEVTQLVRAAAETRSVTSQSFNLRENTRINIQAIPIPKSGSIGLIARPMQHESASGNFYERFMRRIVHDMRNPLAAVIAHANNLYAAPEAGMSLDTVRTTALTIEKEAQRLTRLVDSILFDARLSYVPLNVERLDLVDVIEDVVFQFDEAAAKMNKSVIVETPVEPAIINADRDLVIRALSNLLDNSLKYSAPSSDVRIALESNDLYYVLKVIDSGEGIPQEYLPARIFEPLVRAHPKTDGSGSGLGLSIVKKIAELHGGTVTAQSSPGKGTTMILCLPH
jgi:signal transduction histidine kinase